MSLYYRLEGNRQDEAGGVLPGSSLGNQSLKERIHRRIIEEAASNKLFLPGEGNKQKLQAVIGELCRQMIQAEPLPLPKAEADKIIADMLDEVLGLGPLEGLLQDDSVTEIMVNGPDQVYAALLVADQYGQRFLQEWE